MSNGETHDALSAPSAMERLFHPSAVAVVGASADPTRFSGRPLSILAKQGYAGRLVAVNPRWSMIGKHPCFASLREVPGPIDVALVCTPAESVPDVLRDCAATGVPNAIVIASGFEETDSGESLAHQVRTIAWEHGLNVVGPNSEGLWSIPDRALLTFGSVALREDLIDGPVSILSQSGSLGAALIRMLQDGGTGCRYFVSVGNETVLNMADYLEYILREGESSVIALFIEAISDPRMVDLLDEARRQRVQIVALRAGSSERGRAATLTHSGRMASGSQIYRDVLRHVGVIEVDSLQDLAACCEVLAGSPLPRTDHAAGVAVIAVSGGSRALIVDECVRQALPLATFDSTTTNRLKEALPEYGSAANPVDVTGTFLSDSGLFEAVISAVAGDSDSGSVLIQLANGGRGQLRDYEHKFATLADRFGKPVMIGLLGDLPDSGVLRRLRTAGVQVAPDPVVAVRRLMWLYRCAASTKGVADRNRDLDRTVPDVIAADVDALLCHLGTPAPRSVLVGPGKDLVQACAHLHPPYVAKSPHGYTIHRSEEGLVQLNLRNSDELAAAVEALRTVLGDTPVLVQEQVAGTEVLLAVMEDPDLGPVLVLGTGGVRTEIEDDVVYLPIPASVGEIKSALAQTQLHRRLVPWRNEAGADVATLIQAAYRLANVFLGHRPHLQSIELNPVLVSEHGCAAVDVVVTKGPQP